MIDEAGVAQQPRGLAREGVLGVVGRGARGAEHRHRGAHVAERLEARPQLVEHPAEAVLVRQLRLDVRLLGGDDLLVEGGGYARLGVGHRQG